MPNVSLTLSHETADELVGALKALGAALSGGLPPMQEQPIREPAPPVNDNGTVVTNTPRAGDKPGSRTRKPKEEKEAAGEQKDGAASSTETEATAAIATVSNAEVSSAAAEIPDIEVVRAKLKQMGATDGLGHDKVFETLAHYKSKDDDKHPAKSASTLRPADYIALIAEIDGLLAGVK